MFFTYSDNPSLTSRLSVSFYPVAPNTTPPAHTVPTLPPPPFVSPPTHPPGQPDSVSRRYPGIWYAFHAPLINNHLYHASPAKPFSRPVSHIQTLTQILRKFAHMHFRASFFRSARPDFRLHPPSPAPRHNRLPSSGRRTSQHLFPRAFLRMPVI